MKSSRRLLVIAAACCALVLRAELQQWIQHLDSASTLVSVFFRSVILPSGAVPSRRPPRETIKELSELIASEPKRAELYRLRALEAEQNHEFTTAESDWKSYFSLAQDKQSAATELADYHHRRLQPAQELEALKSARGAPSPAADSLLLASEQISWKLFQRSRELARSHRLPEDAIWNEWLDRYPSEAQLYSDYMAALLDARRFSDAEGVVARYARAFPQDNDWAVRARASIASAQNGPERGIEIYERELGAAMPAALAEDYFSRLESLRRLSGFFDKTRADAASRPLDIAPAERLFRYWRFRSSPEQARRVLLEFEQRKRVAGSALTAAELRRVAGLYEEAGEHADAARHYAALFALASAPPEDAEHGLAGAIRVLFTAPDAPIRLGSGDLSYYQDIASADPYPGTLNGILSLLFNSAGLSWQFSEQENKAVAYFHQAKAAELLGVLDARFPSSPHRPMLHAMLIDTYAKYGESDGVIRRGREFLSAFSNSDARTNVALKIAEAHGRKEQVNEEFAVYDAVLKEMAAKAGGVPLGSAGRARDLGSSGDVPDAGAARSPAYAQVLERYIGRLVSMKRIQQAVALYRTEIDRNPDDPGLYARLAAFLEQNRMAAAIAQTYDRASRRFADRSWHHKLARWYLREKRRAEFDKLTQQIAATFTGTELEAYFQQVVGSSEIDPMLYRQVNLYAHRRFPKDLVFVRNLLNAYSRKETSDPAAWERLLRSYWYYDPDLRSRFFNFLSSTGKLEAELRALEALPESVRTERAVRQTVAESHAWRSHFEQAAPVLQALAAEYPGELELNGRAGTILRSLAGIDSRQAAAAINAEERLHRTSPRDTATMAGIGEIHHENGNPARAREWWNRIADVEPGKPQGFVEAATVYWDYFLFDDSLRVLEQGRAQLSQPELYSFEVGAIHESKGEYAAAVREYAHGAAANPPEDRSLLRLMKLARNPAHQAVVDQVTAPLAQGANPQTDGFLLRTRILETQSRNSDLETLLSETAARTSAHELLERIEELAQRRGFDVVRERVLRRRLAITSDSIQHLRLRITLAQHLETRGDTEAAARELLAIRSEHPRRLGAVRAAADFFWRQKNGKQAVDILAGAAEVATEPMRRRFTLEAATKATESAQYARARALLDPLLAREPLAADAIAAMASAYAAEGNERGLRDFYAARLKQASGEAAASIRRSLIPVLARLNDASGALEQYIALLARYPDDVSLLEEAALFARRYSKTPDLVAHFSRAASESPRDARWQVILARLHSAEADAQAALEAYGRAAALRPERIDLWSETAGLQERLLQFDAAAATYTKLYELSYSNPQWMVKLAETRLRQGQADAAVSALRAGLIDGRRGRAEDYMEAASKLEAWGLLAQAKELAAQGLGLLRPKETSAEDLGAYLRIATRARDYAPAFAAASKLMEPEEHGQLLRVIARAVQEHYTPEEKAAFALFLAKLRQQPEFLAGEIAELAGLLDIAARWYQESLIASPGPEQTHSLLRRLTDLQRRRMRFAELGGQIEAYWKAYPADAEGKDQLLASAARQYRSGGNRIDELRVLDAMRGEGSLGGTMVDRYAELLRAAAPARLTELAAKATDTAVRDAAAASALAGNDTALALRAITARAIGMTPVWSKAYTALTGLHYGATNPAVTAAFGGALGPRKVGDQLAMKPDRDQQLVGDTWFYYAGRYAEFLDIAGRSPDGEAFLLAPVEARPASASAYIQAAAYLVERKQPERAIEKYRHALEFDPERADAHNRLAQLYLVRNERDAALSEWRSALAVLIEQQDARVPEDFWRTSVETIESIGRNGVLEDLRLETHQLLTTYLDRSGVYRIDPLIEAAFRASSDARAGAQWIADISRTTSEPDGFLTHVLGFEWIPPEAREVLYQRLVESATTRASQARGFDRESAAADLLRAELAYIRALLDGRKGREALDRLTRFDAESRRQYRSSVVPLELRAAAQTGTLRALLARYKTDQPPLDLLREQAAEWRTSGDNESARTLLEFVYTSELSEAVRPPVSALLGLAEVRLEQRNIAAAVELLRRAEFSGEPFESLAPAAALLERFNAASEAEEFRKKLAQTVPWDLANRVAIWRQLGDRPRLIEVVKSQAASYETRAAAADALSESHGAGPLGSSELDYLAEAPADPVAAAERRYFRRARLKAASRSTTAAVKVRLLRGAIEIEPDDSVRLALFRAARQAGNHQTAIAALEPMVGEGVLDSLMPRDEEGGYSMPLRDLARSFLPGSAEKARIARELADSYQRLGVTSAAIKLLGVAQDIEPTAQTRAQIQTLEAEARRMTENRKRAPHIHAGLEQDRIVRPRLRAGGAR